MIQQLLTMRNGLTTYRGISTLAVVLLAVASCRREVSAAEMNDNVTSAAQSAPGGGPAPAARFDEAPFSLSMESQGACVVGKPCTVAVTLTAKGAHHVNTEYPHKLKLTPTDGVTYGQAVIGRESMKIETSQARFSVPFTPARSGKLTVGGEFAFSLCTADRCLMEKRVLALDVQVP